MNRSSSQAGAVLLSERTPAPAGVPRVPLSHANLIFVNAKPYWVHSILGKGGFAHVFRVELMIPDGFALLFDGDGNPLTDENDLLLLQDNVPSNAQTSAGGAEGSPTGVPPAEVCDPTTATSDGVAVARSLGLPDRSNCTAGLSFVVTSSMRTDGDEDADGVGGVEEEQLEELLPRQPTFLRRQRQRPRAVRAPSKGPDPPSHNMILEQGASTSSSTMGTSRSSAPTTNEDDGGAVINAEDLVVVGSSVFYALKVQVAKSERQLKAFVQEAETLQAFRDRGRRGSRTAETGDACQRTGPVDADGDSSASTIAATGVDGALIGDRNVFSNSCGIARAPGGDEGGGRGGGVIQLESYEVHPERNQVLILLELADCDLSSFLRGMDYKMDVDFIETVWAGLVRGVQAAHRGGVIHFDLKPHNFLVCGNTNCGRQGQGPSTIGPADHQESTNDDTRGRPIISSKSTVEVGSSPRAAPAADQQHARTPLKDQQHAPLFSLKLADFGLAHRLLNEESHLSGYGTGGTIAYMAPESLHQPSADGKKRLSKAVDIWSLGIILYQMLHEGKTPWDAYFGLGQVRLALVIADVRSEIKYELAECWREQKTLMRRRWGVVWEEELRAFEAERRGGGEDEGQTLLKEETESTISDAGVVSVAPQPSPEIEQGARRPRPQSPVAVARIKLLHSLLARVLSDAVRTRVRLEVLLKICRACLRFDAESRPDSEALVRQIEHWSVMSHDIMRPHRREERRTSSHGDVVEVGLRALGEGPDFRPWVRKHYADVFTDEQGAFVSRSRVVLNGDSQGGVKFIGTVAITEEAGLLEEGGGDDFWCEEDASGGSGREKRTASSAPRSSSLLLDGVGDEDEHENVLSSDEYEPFDFEAALDRVFQRAECLALGMFALNYVGQGDVLGLAQLGAIEDCDHRQQELRSKELSLRTKITTKADEKIHVKSNQEDPPGTSCVLCFIGCLLVFGAICAALLCSVSRNRGRGDDEKNAVAPGPPRPPSGTFLVTSTFPNDATQPLLSDDGLPFLLSHVWDYRENCHCDRIWDDSIFNPNDPSSSGHTVHLQNENNIDFRTAPRPSSGLVQLVEGPHGSRYGFRYEHKDVALAHIQRLYFSPRSNKPPPDVRVIAAHLSDMGDRHCWAFPKNPSITAELCRRHLKCHPNYGTKAVALRRSHKEVRARQLAAAKSSPVWEQHMNCQCSLSGKIVESDAQLDQFSDDSSRLGPTKLSLGPSWDAFGDFFTDVLKKTASNVVVLKRDGCRFGSAPAGWVAWLQRADLKVEECSAFLRCKPDLGITVVLRRNFHFHA